MNEAEAAFGPMHAVVNNAGVTATRPALDQDERNWDSVVDTNLKGVWLVAQAAARRMIDNKVNGSIVNIASILGLRVAGAVAPYAISKAGVIQMTKALALEWARYGIRVNALAPGYFVTELNDDFFESDAGKALVKRVPQRRLGSAQRIGRTAAAADFQRGIVHDWQRDHRRRRTYGFRVMTLSFANDCEICPDQRDRHRFPRAGRRAAARPHHGLSAEFGGMAGKICRTLAKQFTVITFDNRGTGHSDKPVTGYALANMARDVGWPTRRDRHRKHLRARLLDGRRNRPGIRQAVSRSRYRPDPLRYDVRRSTRDLCGTFRRACHARPRWVISGTNSATDLAGHLRAALSGTEPETQPRIRCGARSRCRRRCMPRTCNFRHSPNSTARRALSQIKCPTLVLTGDLDQLIPPQNSRILAKLIPGATLVVMPGGGHRVLWEAVEELYRR